MQVVGPYTSPTLFSENPGRVYIQNLTPTIVGAPGFVDIAGTRTWGNMGSGGNYLARAGSEGNGRSNVTFLIEVDLDEIPIGNGTQQVSNVSLIMSSRFDITRRLNWCIASNKYSGGARNSRIQYNQSASSGVADLTYTSDPYSVIVGKVKYAITMGTGGVGDVAVNLYQAARATVTTVSRAVTTGTMGGDEAIVWLSGVMCAKLSRVVSDSELDAWFADGTIPATDREFVFAGGHEIVESAPVIWDSGPNAYDLTATQIANLQPPSMRVDYTDDPGNPVVPFTSFSVYPLTNGNAHLRFVRERQGVPSRATDEERFETYDWNFTVSDAPSTEQTVVPLFIYADREGTANISCDVPGIIDFPASVGVVAGSTVVQGTIVGAGTVNVTVELNGETSVTPFTIESITPTVSVGPIQNIRSRLT